MKQFEYRMTRPTPAFVDYLNVEGAQGWELVTIIGDVAFLKREKEIEPPAAGQVIRTDQVLSLIKVIADQVTVGICDNYEGSPLLEVEEKVKREINDWLATQGLPPL